MLQGAALFGEINALHTAFPQDAEMEYMAQADLILRTLKLDSLRDTELERLRRVHTDSEQTSCVSSTIFTLTTGQLCLYNVIGPKF